MKYYIYISDTKVDMLYAQIPPRIRNAIASEFTIDLKIIKSSISKAPDTIDRYSKLDLITKYLLEHEHVGTIEKPAKYFKARLPLSWGYLEGHSSSSAFFGGVIQDTVIGLTGSLKHVLGHADKIPHTEYHPASDSPDFFSFLHEYAKEKASFSILPKFTRQNELQMIEFATKTITKTPPQSLEFIAKRLVEGYYREGKKRVLLGSPVYVALDN